MTSKARVACSAVLSISLGFVGCGGVEDGTGDTSSVDPSSSTEPTSTAGSEKSGTQIFSEQCAGCHGATGEGVGISGPELLHPVRDYATWVIRNGRLTGTPHADYRGSTMVAYSSAVVSDVQLSEILDFLSAPSKPTDGPGLYADFCAHCHGATGAGVAPINWAISGLDVETLKSNVRSGHHLGEFENRAENMPQWSALELSDGELELIAQFLAP